MFPNILFLQALTRYDLNVNWLFQGSEEFQIYLALRRGRPQIMPLLPSLSLFFYFVSRSLDWAVFQGRVRTKRYLPSRKIKLLRTRWWHFLSSPAYENIKNTWQLTSRCALCSGQSLTLDSRKFSLWHPNTFWSWTTEPAEISVQKNIGQINGLLEG